MNNFFKLKIAVLASVCAANAFAQMQIPNPLIQPQKRSTLSPETKEGQILPAGGSSNTGRSLPEGNYVPPMNAYGSNQQSQQKTPFSEVRERLSSFYVSAIVGNQAILRKSLPLTQSPTAVNSNQNLGGMMPPSGIQQPVKQLQTQTETMFVKDGEPIDFLGDSIILTPKVTNSRVYIYYTEDGTSMKGGSARRQVAFVGQIESTVAATPPAIVLEKPDATYKQKISVTPKNSGGSNSGSSSGSGSGNGQYQGASPNNVQ